MNSRQAAVLMVQGTASDVGKSILTTALCRIFTQDGYRTAPFKSQNMSLNAYVTWDGKEIGRAQGMQADACRIPATTDMNPILLKPSGMMTSQVVVHGVPLRDYDARAYREQYLAEAEPIVRASLARLRESHDLVLLEGAGSPAEVNLKDRDIVNMRMAEWADAPVLLAADIDRGGVFASIVGTMAILEPHERDRVAGFIINKFRGDVTLLKPGLDWLEERTGKPVLGVIPYLPDLGLEDEDSLSLDRRSLAADRHEGERLDIAVLRLPRISNFTDFDPLQAESDVAVRYVTTADQLGNPDAVIIPGSKNTAEDLLHLRETGIAAKLERYKQAGGHIVGICGGYEMMGRTLSDPERIESEHASLPGFGWLPIDVTFEPRKRTVRVAGFAEHPGTAERHSLIGYEIHMGRAEAADSSVIRPFLVHAVVEGNEQVPYEQPYREGAASEDGKLWGTFMHGVLHNDSFRRAWLNKLRGDRGWIPLQASLRFFERREAAFDRLADHVRAHLDMDRIIALLQRQRGEDGP
jgi:cobyric acid synthase CobQ